MMKRCFYWCWLNSSLEIIIPKKRGYGYLKQPIGHHFNKEISELETKFQSDISGLDGTISIEPRGDIIHNSINRAKFENEIFPKIEQIFDCRKGSELSWDGLLQQMDKRGK